MVTISNQTIEKTINLLRYCAEMFGIDMKFPMFSLKNEPHSSSLSDVIDSEICAYLNA